VQWTARRRRNPRRCISYLGSPHAVARGRRRGRRVPAAPNSRTLIGALVSQVSPIDETEDVSAQLRQLKQLTREIDNFRDIARYILPTPGEMPRLHGVDIFGGVLPLSGSVGGDHLIYVDFKQRFDLDAASPWRVSRAATTRWTTSNGAAARPGIALIDVSGHR
jgi:hypothetical protein